MKVRYLAVFTAIVAMFTVLFSMFPATAYGVPCSAIGYGQLTGMPQVGTVTFVEFTDIIVPPFTIRTEDNPNSSLGTDQGYQEPEEGVRYFIFYTCPGWRGMILFTGIGDEIGKRGWSEYQMVENFLDLGTVGFSQQEGRPAVPSKPKARWLSKMKAVLLTWKQLERTVYLVYRSTMPSGAGNGHSNGEYNLVGMTESSFFVDRNLPGGISVWYILLAKYDDSNNDPRKLSGHSEESDELFLSKADIGAAPFLRKGTATTTWGAIKSK